MNAGVHRLKPRRRVAIAALVVFVLVSLGTWWNWPRGDARFVGKWEVLFIAPGVVVNQQECVLELRSAGTARKVYADGSSRSFVWTTDGNALVEGWPTTCRPVNDVIQGLCQRIGVNASSVYWISNTIETQTVDSIQLSRPVTFSQATFTRIPE